MARLTEGMAWLAAWCLLAGAYVLLAGEVSWTEGVTGVACGCLVLAYGAVLQGAARRHLYFRAPWLRILGKPILALLVDAARVGGVLLRALAARRGSVGGTMVRQDFDGSSTGAREAVRRGLVVWAASVAPNGYVVQLRPDEHALILHRLAPASPSSERDWPV